MFKRFQDIFLYMHAYHDMYSTLFSLFKRIFCSILRAFHTVHITELKRIRGHLWKNLIFPFILYKRGLLTVLAINIVLRVAHVLSAQ